MFIPGSHGSLTKAGKNRNQTPKVERTGVNSRKKDQPRIRYRKMYDRRILKGLYAGQASGMNAKKSSYGKQ